MPTRLFGKELDPVSYGRKGGKKRKNPFYYIHKCTPRCPFYETCPYVSLSKEKFDGKCAVKQFPKRLQDRTVRWLQGDEDSFMQNIIDYIMKVETNVDTTNNPKLQLQFLRVMKEIYQVAFGQRIKMEASIGKFPEPAELLQDIEGYVKEYYKGDKNKTN